MAHAPRAVPQPCPLLLDHFPQGQLAQLFGRSQPRLCGRGSQDAHSTAGKLQHEAQKVHYRGLAEISMRDLKNGALEDPGTKYLFILGELEGMWSPALIQVLGYMAAAINVLRMCGLQSEC